MDSWLAPFVPRRSISTISAMPEWQSICEAGTMLRQLPQARPPPAAAGAVRAVADSISPAGGQFQRGPNLLGFLGKGIE